MSRDASLMMFDYHFQITVQFIEHVKHNQINPNRISHRCHAVIVISCRTCSFGMAPFILAHARRSNNPKVDL